MRYHYTPSRVAKIQTTDNIKCCEDVEQQELSYIPGGVAKWCSHFGRLFGVSYKTKHTLTIWSSNCTPWYLPKRVENLHPHKNLHTNVYSSSIHRCQNLEANKLSFSRWMNKYTVIHSDSGVYQVMKRHGGTLNAYNEVKEARLRRPDTIWCLLYDSLEKAKLWGQ